MAILVDENYEKGIRLSNKERVALEKRLVRSLNQRWWDIRAKPKTVYLK